VLLNDDRRAERDYLLAAANDGGLTCRPAWTLMHQLPMYRSCPHAPLPVAEEIEAWLINIPSSPKLLDREKP
jgi:perosamine synthetase